MIKGFFTPGLTKERLVVWLVAIVAVVGSLFLGYVGTPYAGAPGQVAEASSSPNVTVSTLDGGGYRLAPTNGSGDGALIFYPGGRVHPSAYVSVFEPLVARAEVTVFLPKAPLNLAVVNPGLARPIIESHPEIDRWYVGGHSLGGAMACRFARGAANPLRGLVLVGAYCDRDISDTDLDVLVIRGAEDGVLNSAAFRRNRQHLPEGRTEIITVEGMNHTQAGSYRGQPGDRPASISYETAHEHIRSELLTFLSKNR